ncbi:hypothetical protein cyc_06736 [Cyclospora cayetanensis]|uniref:Uncharacterized protein n=1 Tax=Cyclospora cayetanensis TaxID=88456 RepID=A0A1D3CYQ4_9EIME|nr:hypothetical protein cyc_06736 [Cyclospora cayetanensis]
MLMRSPPPASAPPTAQQQHAVLQLCLCRLVSSAAACTPAAAWRVACAVQGTGTAAAAASCQGTFGGGGGEREPAQHHPLNTAMHALCEGPSRHLLARRRRRNNSQRAEGTPDSDQRPPPPPAQGCLCSCTTCVKETAAQHVQAGVASAGETQAADERVAQTYRKTSWNRAWGSFSVRCCCLACREEMDPLGEALRLLLLLLLHSDLIVSETLLQPRRHLQQLQSHAAARGSHRDSASSSSRLGDDVTLLRSAVRGLPLDRELDALCFLAGLSEAFLSARAAGRFRLSESTARHLCFTNGPGGFALPGLLHAFTAREDLNHLLQPLLWRRPPEGSEAAAAVYAGESHQQEVPSSREAGGSQSGERFAFFSSSWVAQRFLAFLLLLAAARSLLRKGLSAEDRGAITESVAPRKDGMEHERPLLSLALAIRPLQLPPQQDLLLQLFKAQPALLPPFLASATGLLLSPRQSSTFALSCLFLCRVLEAPWVLPVQQQQQILEARRQRLRHERQPQLQPLATADVLPEPSRLYSAAGRGLLGLALCEHDLKFSTSEAPRAEFQVVCSQEAEQIPYFEDLEARRLQHAQMQHKRQDVELSRRRIIAVAGAYVASPALLLRQHLSQCLLQPDVRTAFCGVALLRACCKALRCMHGALSAHPDLQRLLLAEVGPRLPDAKTLVNSLLRLLQQEKHAGTQQLSGSKKGGHAQATPPAAAHQEELWQSDEALSRAAAASAAAAAKEKQKQEVERARRGSGEAADSENDELEIHVDGIEEATADAECEDSCSEEEDSPEADSTTLCAASRGVVAEHLMQLFAQLTSLRPSAGAPHADAGGHSSVAAKDGVSSTFFLLLLGWMEVAEAYQELMTPSFPLDWGKLLCTWKPVDSEDQRSTLCCRSRNIAKSIIRLGVQARGGVGAWGREIAAGGAVSKQHQLVLLHLLLQWHQDAQGNRQCLLSPCQKNGSPDNDTSAAVISDEPLQNLLGFMHTSGLFSLDPAGAFGVDEAAVWLTALEESSCFRCSALYFVGVLRLASERRLALLPYVVAPYTREGGDETAAQEEAAWLLSPFSAALLAHLSVTPRCNNGRALFIDLPSFGVSAPAESCWGCAFKHSAELCAEAVVQWAVSGLMKCCILRPAMRHPLLTWLQQEGSWRVIGCALNMPREQNAEGGTQADSAAFVEAARAAAAQHPQSKAVNRLRKRLLRFLAVRRAECSVDTNKVAAHSAPQTTLEEQLEHLAGLHQLATNSAPLLAPLHEVAPEALLWGCAARLPGAASPARDHVALAERTNLLGLLGAFTRHLEELQELGGLKDSQLPHGNLQGTDALTSGRLPAVLRQVEAVSWQLRKKALRERRCVSDAGLGADNPCAAVIASAGRPLGRLLRQATTALQRLALTASLPQCADHAEPPASHSTRETAFRKTAADDEALLHWGEIGATLCCHIASLCETFSAGGIPDCSVPSKLRLLRRIVMFFVALAGVQDAVERKGRPSVSFAGCMQRLRLCPVFADTRSQALPQVSELQLEREFCEMDPVQELLRCLLKRVAVATKQLVDEKERPLLLLACESVLGGKDSPCLSTVGSPLGGASDQVHLRWLLPLLEFWALAGVSDQSVGLEDAIQGFTRAEGECAISLLVGACGESPERNNGSISTATLVQRLEALHPPDAALRLYDSLSVLSEQLLADQKGARVKETQHSIDASPSVLLPSTSALLRAATHVMLCLALQCSPAANLRSGGEDDTNSEGQGILLVFRPSLINAFRASWERNRSLRSACMRMLASEDVKGDHATSVSLHPAVRLALLLQWREPLQNLPSAFYPSLVSELQQFQEEGPQKPTISAAPKRRKRAASEHRTEIIPASRTWAAEVLEALKLSAYARDSRGAAGKRIRTRALQWQIAAAFLVAGWGNEEPNALTEDAPGRWAEGVQRFLAGLCMQQPSGSDCGMRLGMQLARTLEELAGSLEEPFMITDGWPVDGWARYHAAAIALHAAQRAGADSCIYTHSLAAGRTGIGGVLKDLKTELMELQEALQGIGSLHDAGYGGGEEESAVAAAADLAYCLGVMNRAAQLGRVVVAAIQMGVASEAGLTKDQRQCFKALRPKAQAVMCGFLDALGQSPPTAAVHTGAEALGKFPRSERTDDSSPASLNVDILIVQSSVDLFLPAVQLAMAAAALDPSPTQAKSSGKRIARQALLSTALAEVGQAANLAIRRALSTPTGDGSSATASITASMMPLLEYLGACLLPAANAQLAQAEDQHAADAQQAEEEPYCLLSDACPALFEAITNLCGASTSYADSILCRILLLDSGFAYMGASNAEADDSEGRQLPAEAAGESSGSYDVFSNTYMWMTHLPDFLEVASETRADIYSSTDSPTVFCRLRGPCDWLALDPRRMNDTLDNFGFHTRAPTRDYRPARSLTFAATSERHRLLEAALKARCSVSESGDGDEEQSSSAGGSQHATVRKDRLLRNLNGLANASEEDVLRGTTAVSSAYDVVYVIPYLAGRLMRAFFVLLWRWQRQLEEEQALQQQVHSHLGEEESSVTRAARIAMERKRPVCVAEQARRACGVAGAWLRSLEANTTNHDATESAKEEEASQASGGAVCESSPICEGQSSEAVASEGPATKRRREDVWEMNEFRPQEIQLAVTRVSTFLKASRRVGRLWRPFDSGASGTEEGHSTDVELARSLDAWGSCIDDGDQWLSSFASGGGLQLLVMALGCPVLQQQGDAEGGSIPPRETDAIQATSPLVCSFAASVVPFLFVPDHPLYPILNYALLKHSALSLLVHEPCMPLTLAALRQPLLGSDGIFSRLILSPLAASCAHQRAFLLTVLKRAMAVSQCLDDGTISLSARLKAHNTTQAVVPPPAVLSLSALPVLALPTQKLALGWSAVEALLIATAAPPCLSACCWWYPHAAFRAMAMQDVSSFLTSESEEGTWSNGAHLPLATVNAQHLLQRFGLLEWLEAQIEATMEWFMTEAGPQSMKSTSTTAHYSEFMGQAVPPPPHRSKVFRDYGFPQCEEECISPVKPPRSASAEPYDRLDTTKWLPVLKNCTRLMWSVLAAATLAPPLLDVTVTDACQWDKVACFTSQQAFERETHVTCRSITPTGTATRDEMPFIDLPGPWGLLSTTASWPPKDDKAEIRLLNAAIIRARHQLFGLRQRAGRNPSEDAGSCRGGVTGCTRASSAYEPQSQAARQLQLNLLQGIQRLARTWFAFVAAAGVIVREYDGISIADGACKSNPSLVADVHHASVACLSALWAVASCSQSIGLFFHPSGSGDSADSFEQLQRLQASACCSDVVRLCGWAATLQGATRRRDSSCAGYQEYMNVSASYLVRNLVLDALCHGPSRSKDPGRHWSGHDAASRRRSVLLALLQIKEFCGADDGLQDVISVAAGL